MSQTGTHQWTDYPMGPNLRSYLGIIDAEYSGEHATRPDEDTMLVFQDYLETRFASQQVTDPALFVDLLEELTAMGLSSVTVKLAETHPDLPIDSDFRACLALGSALMMESELEEAEILLKQAQALAPMELAPYVNLASIAFAEERDAEAAHWITQGLNLDPNHFRLWELQASIYLYKDKATAGTRLRSQAEALNSYAGLSLAAEIIDPNDKLLKAQVLEDVFNSGLRDEDFLVEYTAVLGMAQQFEKIPQLVWRLEHLEKKTIHWKLYAHAAQAFLAMNQEEQAAELIRKVSSSGDIPANVLQDLQLVYDEHLQQIH
ncbi:MAG: hypothetical protein NTX25_05755 [Proteobacteria bacterium]|nr:hypothetical protein [Pseudomonadota bacterium]